jgi:DMSO/TMAO reductase YedYZ molybdopterin-dependent catalytic subunit
MPDKKKPTIFDRTVDRRSLLEWLGKGCVLVLGASQVTSCLGADGPLQDAGSGGRPDGGGGGDVSGGDGPTAGGFSFEPGPRDHPVYENWGERTVDRQDIEDILATWQLTVDGLVESPRVYSFADLLGLPRTDNLVDFHCVEGWSIHDVPWNGVHLARLFDQVRPLEGATHVTFHTIDGRYNESLPLDVALEPKTLLAYGIDGNTLPLKHGFPLRIVVPRLFAYKSAKYVARIELDDKPVSGFWVAAGYPYLGEVPASRLRDGRY